MLTAIGEAVRGDVDDAHDQWSRANLSCAIPELPNVKRHRKSEIRYPKSEIRIGFELRISDFRFYYQGFSIIETTCTARRSTFFFFAVVIDSPSSGMKPPMDCTRM